MMFEADISCLRIIPDTSIEKMCILGYLRDNMPTRKRDTPLRCTVNDLAIITIKAPDTDIPQKVMHPLLTNTEEIEDVCQDEATDAAANVILNTLVEICNQNGKKGIPSSKFGTASSWILAELLKPKVVWAILRLSQSVKTKEK